MLKGYRLLHVALGGCIAVAVVSAAGYGLIERHKERDRAYETSRQKYEASKGDLPPGVATPDGNRSVPDPKSYREEWRGEHDLQAQREMADWTFFMLLAAFVSVVVTGIGVMYVARTLNATREAVGETKRGTAAALVAAEAGKRANEIAQESAERQLRAYIGVEQANITMTDDGEVSYFLKYTNFGQTPASDVIIRSSCTVTPLPWEPGEIVDPRPDERKSTGPLWTGGHVTKTQFVPDPGTQKPARFPIGYRENIEAARAAIFLHGKITYRDVFKQTRTTSFRYIYTGKWGGTQPLEVCNDGNDAT